MMNMMGPWGHGWNNMMGWGGGMGVLGLLSTLLTWGLVIAGAVILVRYLGKKDGPGRTPLEILKDRYARGEIDKREFEEKKKDLG